MTSYALCTASGRDRVGIVETLSEQLLARGCNIESSRMALLGGDFAMIVLVSGSEEAIEATIRASAEIASATDLEFVARVTSPQPAEPGRPYVIESVSLDTPGIVHAVTKLLRDRNVNIGAMDTETRPAPFTGAPMFHMRVTAIVPSDVHARDLRSDLEALAARLDLDITVRPAAAREE